MSPVFHSGRRIDQPNLAKDMSEGLFKVFHLSIFPPELVVQVRPTQNHAFCFMNPAWPMSQSGVNVKCQGRVLQG